MILLRGVRLRRSFATFLCVAAVASNACRAASVGELVKDLSAADAKQRADAADELGSLGADAQTASSALQAALKDRSPEVRWRAARALGSLGGASAATVSALVGSLRDEDPQTRAYASMALGELGASDRSVVDALAPLMADKDPTVRRAALRSLRGMKLPRDVTIPLFVKTLSSADPRLAMAALQTISEAGGKAVPFLRDALADPKAACWAVVALGGMGPEAAEAAPEIAKLLASANPQTRLEACMTLGVIGPAVKPAIPALAKMVVEDPVPGVRYSAAYALGAAALNEPAAVEALQTAGKSGDTFLKMVSCWALAKINPNDPAQVSQAVTFLVEGLKSDKASIRLAALQALVALKPSADIVGPALVSALKDADPRVASQAIDMLGSMGSEVTPEVVKALKTPGLQEYALRIIYRFGAEAKGAVPELIALLKDPQLDPKIRREAHFALAQIGPAAAPASPQLVAALGSTNERIRNSAIFALGRIGPGAYEAAPALEKLSASDDEFLRIGCLWALVGIKPGDAALAEKATPELIKGLSSEREMVRLESVRTLGALGPAAKSALPALRRLADDPSPTVAELAVNAVAAIEGRKTGATDGSSNSAAPHPKTAEEPPAARTTAPARTGR